MDGYFFTNDVPFNVLFYAALAEFAYCGYLVARIAIYFWTDPDFRDDLVSEDEA